MTITSLLLIALSMTLLRLTWRKKGRAFIITKVCIWTLVIGALVLLSTTVGPEFGVAFGFMAVSIAGFALVLINGDYQSTHKPAKRTATHKAASHNSALTPLILQHRAALLIITGPLALLATCLVTLLMVSLMPAQLDTQMASAAFLFPCLYGLTVYFLCAQAQPFKHAMILLALSVMTGAYLYL
ncbi:hypothetical protein [Marinagarivorans algicola]|uniref:hypothetical protein n=1 Tax=Marinagarivorans algicola TaxID=1513270 RepID=UPI0006B8C0E0|nr:hypothetical protein [Marinagarivorans algicola]